MKEEEKVISMAVALSMVAFSLFIVGFAICILFLIYYLFAYW